MNSSSTHRNDLCVETRPVLSVLQSVGFHGFPVPLPAVCQVPIPAAHRHQNKFIIIMKNFNRCSSHGHRGSKCCELAQHAHSCGSTHSLTRLYINTDTTTLCEALAQLLITEFDFFFFFFCFEGTCCPNQDLNQKPLNPRAQTALTTWPCHLPLTHTFMFGWGSGVLSVSLPRFSRKDKAFTPTTTLP